MTPPVRLGPYCLGEKLGFGNFSTVRLATDEGGKKFAVKIIDKTRLRKEKMEDQMLREVAIMRSIKHRNVIDLHDVLESANHYYLVLEFVSGGELFDKIVAAKRFDEPTARRYFQQLIAGVHHCHGKGFAHRDLKPENLLLDAVGVLKISDFGLGNRQQDILLKTVCGTPNYVAPEVLMERGYNGLCADIWSCGVILYVMLAGRLPFEDRSMRHLLARIERGEYSMVRHVSDAAKDLIARMLVVNPKKRITLEAIISHPWFVVDWDPKCLNESA
ncbi:serine/threonine kinase, putative [Trypanosoma brucei gambiense DAL972]|uniref:non-specific serine/threonine protein kinase n=3 Tax=Trypanosoma brucei TaxID=5691 RepID=Q388P9_TRYB2|nr:serine/threonine kinase, putative [Trypanosoma brucei gambiense DAL972]XP_827833.1 serine/threonine kinase, putative [Trypanosoma brucei brucei TREU927]EAN78721.1 serine/threonine kinase, putative [Trypanosoma brucei brucei TREU927]RHW68715.1 serine/threonine kinase [Trypanosoma brucei equiperdum]CBH16529.1 serine/threonine kinase, putative [Trypanosoma brucei gambiense DAL972]|eukprot:XP_011778793.1 serine/threonine kinase, putative [Trypanosoma brucei gambiense DAL972]